MNDLFNAQPIYFLMALIGTLLFTFKLILLFMAGDADLDAEIHGDFEADFDGELEADVHADSSAQFTLLSVQSILAFLMGTGWLGLAASTEWGLGKWLTALVAACFGLLMMLFSSFLTFKMKGLNSKNMRVDYRNAIGLQAIAYTNIVKNASRAGQIQITFKGKQQILQAKTDEEDSLDIVAFSNVEVIDADNSGILTVKRIENT